jgi:NAD(P)H-hydrate epimerase
VVLTPHEGEFRSLLGALPGDDRIDAARRLARASGVVALVKGPTTSVAGPEGRVLLATAGSPALATAGTGDVLSGMIGAFLARGVAPLEAAAVAAHVHGRAGARGKGQSLIAGDLPDLVADVLAEADDRARSTRESTDG